MKSFPSTLNESESMYGSGKAQSFLETFDVERLKAVNLNTSVPVIQEQLKEPNIIVSNFNAYPGMINIWHNEYSDTEETVKDYNRVYYENVHTLPANAIALMKDYDWIYKYQANSVIGSEKSGDSLKINLASTSVVPSMFNGLYGVRAMGMISNTPLLNDYEDMGYDANVDDCSIRTLCALSKEKNSPLGMERFKYADFMYCKDLGKVSNNHLIVLRKFAHPVPDHIGKGTTPQMWGDDKGWNWKIEGDVGRLVTWFDTDDNKLEDIAKFSLGATWKELQAEIEPKDSTADNPNSGILGMISNSLNPAYNKAVGEGQAGNHSLLTWLGLRIHPGVTQGIGQNNVLLSNYDTYKVYTPQNTIQSNHIYEGKIQFSHEFSLTFNYELRGYDNINPRSAFLDLMGNIFEVTGRRGKFWGGDRKVIGPEQDLSTYNMVDKFINQKFDEIPGFLASFKNGGNSFSKILGQLGSFAQDVLGSVTDAAKSIIKGKGKEIAANLAENVGALISGTASAEAVKGLLKNALGRPQLYAWHSLVRGDDVGLWHVTVGNPKNPILSIGNLIMTNAEVSQYGPLGLDDFPTGLKVTVSLKHPRPRDITDIGRMYTGGIGAIYHHFGGHKVADFFKSDPGGETTKAGDMPSNMNQQRKNNQNEIKKNANIFVPSTDDNLSDPSLTTETARMLNRTNAIDHDMLVRMIQEAA